MNESRDITIHNSKVSIPQAVGTIAIILILSGMLEVFVLMFQYRKR